MGRERFMLARTAWLIAVLAAMLVLAEFAPAQTFTVIHSFYGLGGPEAGLTIDRAGHLYGTAAEGCGEVFELVRTSSGWIFNTLYYFSGGQNDGCSPQAGVTIGPNGTLYGTTVTGGATGADCPPNGCGAVYNLRPPARACKTALCSWTKTLLYRFAGGSDGATPSPGNLVFDSAGNLYGTTVQAGLYGDGGVYELFPANGSWNISVLHQFTGGIDGRAANGGVILGNDGSLYGTTKAGGAFSGGTVYQLAFAGSGWNESILYNFNPNDDTGSGPEGGVIFDPAGNLYGTTVYGGANYAGTVFKLTPVIGGWQHSVLYRFSGSGNGPFSHLVMDGAGNLYGTTNSDGAYGHGSVFELIPNANGSWSYRDLHDFTGGNDGSIPFSWLIFDAKGNLYGTAFEGGAYGLGVVFEITP